MLSWESSITYSQPVSVALVIQHSMHMRHVILSFVARLLLVLVRLLGNNALERVFLISLVVFFFWISSSYLLLVFSILLVLKVVKMNQIPDKERHRLLKWMQ
jgi:hypothetical protein